MRLMVVTRCSSGLTFEQDVRIRRDGNAPAGRFTSESDRVAIGVAAAAEQATRARVGADHDDAGAVRVNPLVFGGQILRSAAMAPEADQELVAAVARLDRGRQELPSSLTVAALFGQAIGQDDA